MTATHRKGSAFRRLIQSYLEAHGFACEFRGIGDTGDDITARRYDVVLSVECKNRARMELAAWVDQAVEQAPLGQVPVVIHKRRGKAHPGDQYVTLTLDDFLALVGGA